MNEEIANGISKSKSLVEEGITNLKRDIFNPEVLEAQELSKPNVNFTSESVVSQESGELSINTRDVDSVNITFQDFERIEFSQKQVQQLSKEIPQVEGVRVSQPFKNDAGFKQDGGTARGLPQQSRGKRETRVRQWRVLKNLNAVDLW
jgi:hypothetical protein